MSSTSNAAKSRPYLHPNESPGLNAGIYVIGIVVFYILQVVGAFVMAGLLAVHVGNTPQIGTAELELFYSNPNFEHIYMNPNLGLCLLILPFFIILIGMYFWLKYVHKRSLLSVITVSDYVDYNRLCFGFGIWFFLSMLMEAIVYFVLGSSLQFDFELKNFIPLIVIAFFLLPIQILVEELWTRGYLLQGLAKTNLRKIIMIIISTAFFALLHAGNPEISKYGFLPMMTYYIIAGATLAIMTIMDDRLELAIGVHWATNFFGAVIINYEASALQTASLFNTDTSNPLLISVLWFFSALLFLYLCQRKYRWSSFRLLLK